MLQRRLLVLICSLRLFPAAAIGQKLDAALEMGGTAFTSDAQVQVPGTIVLPDYLGAPTFAPRRIFSLFRELEILHLTLKHSKTQSGP
jgi:hypothetical protein